METNVAIVDDRDSLVQYSGSWSGGGVSEEFAGTTTYSTTQGSTASFTFDGTSITVYGSVAVKTSPTASMSFVVDNSIQGSYTQPTDMTFNVHHEVLYASPTLNDGSHTLVITQSGVQADGSGAIYLDYFMWNTTSTDVNAYFIDDRDTRIQYEPQWNLFGSDPDFMHTSQGSPGVGATMTLQFEGRGVKYYGGITNGTVPNVMNASMSIDGGAPKFFTPPIQPAAITTNDLIFDSGPLSDGKHTLVVTAENDVPGSPVWVDYFLIVPPAGSSSAAGSTSGSTAGSTSTPLPSLRSTKTTIIIGSAVGAGVVFVLLCAAFLFLVLRQRRRRRLAHTAALDSTSGPFSLKHVSPGSSSSQLTITPFSDFGTPSASHSSVSLLEGNAVINRVDTRLFGGGSPAAPPLTKRALRAGALPNRLQGQSASGSTSDRFHTTSSGTHSKSTTVPVSTNADREHERPPEYTE